MAKSSRKSQRVSGSDAPGAAAELDQDSEKILAKIADEQSRIGPIARNAQHRHQVAIDARRLLDACADFGRPGTSSAAWGRDKFTALTQERLGMLKDWKPTNQAFSRTWVERWCESVPAVRETVGVETVKGLKLHEDVDRLARTQYVRLLVAQNCAAISGDVAVAVAAIRLRLGDRRFELGRFFKVLRKAVPATSSVANLQRHKALLVPANAGLPAPNDGRVPAEAMDLLITRSRLAKVLGVSGADWMKKSWPHCRPEPVRRARARSGCSSRYRLGELYESFRMAAGARAIPPLLWTAQLHDLVEMPTPTASQKSTPRKALQSTKKHSGL